MKFFLIFIGLYCTLVLADLEDNSLSDIDQLKEYIDNHGNFTEKIESLCPGKSDLIKKALKEVANCEDEIDDSLTICAQIQKYSVKCVRPLVQVLETCVPEQSRQLISLTLESLMTTSDYLCKLNGEHIIELANPCLYNFDDKFLVCVEQIRTKLEQFSGQPPTVKDVCQISDNFKPCLTQFINSSCKNTITRESLLGLYEASLKPCKKSN